MPNLYCVTTYSTFRHRYLVEATSGTSASAYVQDLLDAGTAPEEWQQAHIGEVVVCDQPYTIEAAQREHENSDGTGNPWLPIEQFITRKA
jgi:hypothetical protein